MKTQHQPQQIEHARRHLGTPGHGRCVRFITEHRYDGSVVTRCQTCGEELVAGEGDA